MESSRVVKVVVIAGTRPEIIKLAPVIRELQGSTAVSTCIIHTGQHREMGRAAWSWFGLQPDYELEVMEENQPLDMLTGKMMQLLSPIISKEKPQLVVVQGDTASALAGALSAFLQQIPVAHVEAGLRTRQKDRPFPEEMNRVLISQLAEWHFAPTQEAYDNLICDGISAGKVILTGNTIVDSLLTFISIPELPAEGVFEKHPRLLLVTAHRRENQGQGIFNLIAALRHLSAEPNVQILVFVHPATEQILRTSLSDQKNIQCMAPAPYPEFLQWMQKAFLIITDSGGIQEEASVLGKPLVLLRETTERPEAIAAGAVKLTGTAVEAIVAEVQALLNDEAYYRQRSRPTHLYGFGKAAQQIVEQLLLFIL